MEKGIIPKFATIMVCIVVAVTVIMTALVPIISDQTTTKELTPAEGAYGPAVGYYTIASTPTTTTEFFDAYFFFDSDVEDSAITVTIKVNNVQAYNGPLSDLPKMILYADNNVTIYIDGESIYYSGVVNGSYSIRTDATPTIQIYWRQGSYKCTIGNDVFNQTYEDITYYYAAFATDGEYSNFLGDTAPSMDTPSVSVAGMYIGPKMEERTVPNDPFTGSVVLTIIPIIMLVSLVMLCIREFMKKQE